MVRILALTLALASAKPLKIIINGKTLPEHGESFGQLSAHQHGHVPAPAAVAPPEGLCGCVPVPEDQCTCGASLTYLQCVHHRCSAGDCDCPSTVFEDECSALSQGCSSELTFLGCATHHTSCEGNFNQAADGTMGLTLDTTGLTNKAYCGPHSRCTGEIHVTGNVHRPEPGTWMECVIPASPKKLYHCRKEVTDEGAVDCKLTMPAKVEPKEAVRGRCWLTAGKKGAALTKDAWFVVRNRYSAVAAVVATAPKAVKAPKTTVVLERADDSAAEKEAEIKEEEVEEKIAEDTETSDDSESGSGDNFFKKHTPAKVTEGVGAKTKAPKLTSGHSWIPVAIIAVLVLTLAALLAARKNTAQDF